MDDQPEGAMDYIAPGQAGLPAPDGGADFIATLVSHFAAGNELLDREAGGVVRTVAKVESITRIRFDPMEGQPDQRDYRLAVPAESRQWGRRGVPVHRSGLPPTESADDTGRPWSAAYKREDASG